MLLDSIQLGRRNQPADSLYPSVSQLPGMKYLLKSHNDKPDDFFDKGNDYFI